MTIKTRFYLHPSGVRQMCIKYNYCTRCDNEEYIELLQLADGEVTDKYVLNIAQKIAHYSDSEKWMFQTGCTYVEFVEQIAYDILNDCCGVLVEVSEC